MKVTVELSDTEMKEVRRVTGERKKGPAIRRLVVDALKMKRREEIAGKFISGRQGVELSGFEAARAADRAGARKRGQKWRGS
jgi:hypothetical protein